MIKQKRKFTLSLTTILMLISIIAFIPVLNNAIKKEDLDNGAKLTKNSTQTDTSYKESCSTETRLLGPKPVYASCGGDSSDKSPTCSSSYDSAEICCQNESAFHWYSSSSSVLTACANDCQLLTQACTAANPGICKTVWLDTNFCGKNPCSYSIDTLSCPPPQSTACGLGPARASGLISTTGITTPKFGTSAGVCVVDERAAFIPIKIPTYEQMKQTYYVKPSNRNKKPIVAGTLYLPSILDDQTIYLKEGELAISSSPTGGGTAVVFVDGNLIITGNNVGVNQSGLVFVVGGDVFIDKSVTRIDAVIIAQGTICTSSAGSSPCPAGFETAGSVAQLVINGSLINLDPEKPVKFRRNLTDNYQPAEKIVHQVKYLAILRNLFADTLQKWSETP